MSGRGFYSLIIKHSKLFGQRFSIELCLSSLSVGMSSTLVMVCQFMEEEVKLDLQDPIYRGQ